MKSRVRLPLADKNPLPLRREVTTHSKQSVADAVQSPAREIAVQFARFAPYYDRFMNKYVNYKAWTKYVLRIFRHYHAKPKVLLDLACGSGIPTMLLASEGYRIYGVDRSEAMLNVLREKIEEGKGQTIKDKRQIPTGTRNRITPIQADIRDFILPEPVDAAICLYDSINYLLTPDDLVRCFQSVGRNLKPHGIFAFDMNTVFGLATFWGDRTNVREVEDIYSIWATSFDPDTRVSTLHLTFYVREEMGHDAASCPLIRYDEIHEERGYYIEEIEACLVAAGFRYNDFYQHSTFQAPNSTSTRIMVVARK